MDPVHAVDGDAGAFAVDVIDEEFADENGCVCVAFSDARDHFFGADGDFGYSWDGKGLEVVLVVIMMRRWRKGSCTRRKAKSLPERKVHGHS